MKRWSWSVFQIRAVDVLPGDVIRRGGWGQVTHVGESECSDPVLICIKAEKQTDFNHRPYDLIDLQVQGKALLSEDT